MNSSRVPKSYESLYDKYASIIYGNICKVVDDKRSADKIFREIFPEMIRKKIIERGKPVNIAILLRFIYSFTSARISKNNTAQKDSEQKMSVIKLACSDCSSLQQAAQRLGIANHEAAKNLYYEFAAFKNQASAV
ncbi:MAG: hypothetical protein ABIP30_09540 [Ferruginibacter sp.]